MNASYYRFRSKSRGCTLPSTYKYSSEKTCKRNLLYLVWISLKLVCVYKTKRSSSSNRQVETKLEDVDKENEQVHLSLAVKL